MSDLSYDAAAHSRPIKGATFMSFSVRSVMIAVLALLCFAAPRFVQSQVKQPAAKTPGGSVSGRITIKDKPASGVVVALRRSEGGNPWEAVPRSVTDQNGVYRITNVAAGSYAVTPSTPAYIPADSAGRKNVVVAEDENVDDVNFSLIRGGVITGRVTDAEGRPVIQQQVEIYRAENLDQRQQAQGQRPPIYPARSAQTDDRGIYRAFGLAPGRYKISAGRSEFSMTSFSITPIAYGQVFHPDAKDSAKATVIEVSEGSEATNIDIALGPTLQMFSASGRVINSESGAPVPQIRFGLHRIKGERVEYVNLHAISNTRGEFMLEGLTPGKYGIYLFTDQSTELRVERTTFDVIDSDLTGLTIKLAKAATVSGVAILESDDKVAQRKFLEMKLHGYVESFPGTSIAVSSPIAADGSFRLTGLPNGTANFAIFPAGGFVPTGFVIARIERDGAPVPGLILKDGETVTGVKVIVRYGTSSVRGVVTFENGTLEPNMRVMVRLSKGPGEGLPYDRQAQVDARNQFFIDNIPSGMYELRITVFGAGISARTLEQKKEVSLTDGTVANVTLTVDVSTLKKQ